MPIARSCRWIDGDYEYINQWWCRAYQKEIEDCGEDCPKYEYDKFNEIWNKEQV